MARPNRCANMRDEVRLNTFLLAHLPWLIFTLTFSWARQNVIVYTVKLERAKLPANAGDFTCGSQVKRPHTQFTCVKCSLPVNTGKFTRVFAASTSRRIQTSCLQPHVKLPGYNGYFTSNFTCRTHANLPATSMQSCLFLQAKIHAICRSKHSNRR